MRFFNDKDIVHIDVAGYFKGIVTLNVQIASNGYTGNEQAEIFLADLNVFLQEMKLLESTRFGEVVLKSINPLVFHLGFKGRKNYQDFLIHGHLRSLGVEIYGDFQNSINFAFRLDQSYLWTFIHEFEEMVLSL